MTYQSYQHLVILADRSGSMWPVAEETSQGIAAYVASVAGALEAGARATVSLFEFDHEHDTVTEFTDIHEFPGYVLKPRGSTALLDAVAFVITSTGEQLAAMPEDDRPGSVIVLIGTDGQENASREYTLRQVKDMIAFQREKYGWVFVYLGANQDAFQVAGAMGVPAATTMNYNTTATAGTYASVTTMVNRGNTSGVYAFASGERAAAGGQDTSG